MNCVSLITGSAEKRIMTKYSVFRSHNKGLLSVYFLVCLIAFVPIHFQSVLAECLRDEDWPDKPCLDSGTHSKDEIIQLWAKYYDLKGKAWMDMKKAELDKAITSGTYGDLINDPVSGPANKNVYFYYRIHDEAPNMVLDPYSGNYVIQGSLPLRGEWYASTMGITAIIGVGAVAAAASFFAYRKALRKSTRRTK